jgi:hypothetical protein
MTLIMQLKAVIIHLYTMVVISLILGTIRSSV